MNQTISLVFIIWNSYQWLNIDTHDVFVFEKLVYFMLILNGKIVLDIVFLTFILKAVPFKHISHPPPKKGAVVDVIVW